MARHALSLSLLLAAAGCDGVELFAADSCRDDPEASHFAINPATDECWEFASSCDVPPEWAACGGGCTADSDCREGEGCIEARCEPRGAACAGDEECPLTQHCDAAAGACVDNAPCSYDADCAMGQWCDLDPDLGTDCDPSVPGCGEAPLVGLCSRGDKPPVDPTDPATCAWDAECPTEHLCPAQYGLCSEETPDGFVCPSYCEPICVDPPRDPSMPECAEGYRCNAAEVCAGWRTNPPGIAQCVGWCVKL